MEGKVTIPVEDFFVVKQVVTDIAILSRSSLLRPFVGLPQPIKKILSAEVPSLVAM